MPDEARLPEPPPVVAGIVTSDRGVLVGKRNDGKPPWTFIAGEIEPGESPTDAIVREVKEETGLRVRAAEREIGRRVHPKTGRTMIYLACEPIAELDVFVGDPDELAEVRWVGLPEAEKLLPAFTSLFYCTSLGKSVRRRQRSSRQGRHDLAAAGPPPQPPSHRTPWHYARRAPVTAQPGRRSSPGPQALCPTRTPT